MRLRGKTNINLKFGLNVRDVHADGEELAIHPFSEKFLAEAEPGARAPRREEGAQVVC